jgi:hypothetical protein
MKIKLFCRAVLFLFGTFLHEFSHFAVALFLGKPEGFSIMPRMEGGVYIFGAVRARRAGREKLDRDISDKAALN